MPTKPVSFHNYIGAPAQTYVVLRLDVDAGWIELTLSPLANLADLEHFRFTSVDSFTSTPEQTIPSEITGAFLLDRLYGEPQSCGKHKFRLLGQEQRWAFYSEFPVPIDKLTNRPSNSSQWDDLL